MSFYTFENSEPSPGLHIGEQKKKTGRRIRWRNMARNERRVYCHINYIFDEEKMSNSPMGRKRDQKNAFRMRILAKF